MFTFVVVFCGRFLAVDSSMRTKTQGPWVLLGFAPQSIVGLFGQCVDEQSSGDSLSKVSRLITVYDAVLRSSSRKNSRRL